MTTSAFQDAPYAYGSIGDEKARWSEFVAFRNEFACPGCGRTKFKRPHDLKKPVYAHLENEKKPNTIESGSTSQRLLLDTVSAIRAQ